VPWIREAEAELLYEHAPLGLCILDTGLRYVRVNRTLAEINGAPAEEHIGRTVREMVPDFGVEVEARMRGVLETGVPVREVEVTGEAPSRPGVARSWSESCLPLHDEAGEIVGLGVIVYETTVLRQAEQELRELTAVLERKVAERTAVAELRSRQLQALAVEVIEAGELERSQIAELLHDELQQLIASARLRVDAATRATGSGDGLAGVDEVLVEALGISARLSHHLSPALLHHVSLQAALEWLARDMAEQFALEVEMAADGLDDLAATALTTFLFRAVEELLLNVAKHAGTPRARVTVTRLNDHVAVRVEDDGRGFDPDSVTSAGSPVGFGLLKLRERAAYIGGSLQVDSKPGRGATLTLTVPLRLEAEDAADAAAAGVLRAADGDGSQG
jgi:PAS domain S-box-containing protein